MKLKVVQLLVCTFFCSFFFFSEAANFILQRQRLFLRLIEKHNDGKLFSRGQYQVRVLLGVIFGTGTPDGGRQVRYIVGLWRMLEFKKRVIFGDTDLSLTFL